MFERESVPAPYNSPQMDTYSKMPTIKQRLDKAVADAEIRLAQVKEARAIFDRNPDMERLIEIMQHGGF